MLDCQAGTPPAVDDGVVCTDDSCDEVGDVVVNTTNDANCDNGMFCDGAETCDAVLDCQAGTDPCAGRGCDETADVCEAVCFDADCDDALFCNGMEMCSAGACVPGTPPVVDDGVDCTVDSCDEATDTIVNAPSDANCEATILLDDVSSMLAGLNIHGGTKNALSSKLDTASNRLEDDNSDNDAAAIGVLEAVIHNLEAQRGKKISVRDADLLIAALREIIDLLLASGPEGRSTELFEMIQEREPISRGKTRRK